MGQEELRALRKRVAELELKKDILRKEDRNGFAELPLEDGRTQRQPSEAGEDRNARARRSCSSVTAKHRSAGTGEDCNERLYAGGEYDLEQR